MTVKGTRPRNIAKTPAKRTHDYEPTAFGDADCACGLWLCRNDPDPLERWNEREGRYPEWRPSPPEMRELYGAA